MATYVKEDMSSVKINGVQLTVAGETVLRLWLRLHDIRDRANSARSPAHHRETIAMLDGAIDYAETALAENDPPIRGDLSALREQMRHAGELTGGEPVSGEEDVDRAARRGTPSRNGPPPFDTGSRRGRRR